MMPPWELLGGLLTGVAALVTALVGGARVVSELRAIRSQATRTAADTAAVLAQQHTNGGSTLRDDVKRVLVLSQQNAQAINEVKEAQKRHDAELGRVNRHVMATGERITLETAHTASRLDDLSERIRKTEEQIGKQTA
jgi:hypothetical protein|nr:MAG TPA: hypothetical protein [Caudoviricetes sp.]